MADMGVLNTPVGCLASIGVLRGDRIKFNAGLLPWELLDFRNLLGFLEKKRRQRKGHSIHDRWLLRCHAVLLDERGSKFGCVMSLDDTEFGMLQRRVNNFWREYGNQQGSTVLRHHPEVFAIKSTNYCNLRYLMCPRGEPDIMEHDLGNLPKELFQKILGERSSVKSSSSQIPAGSTDLVARYRSTRTK